MAPFLLSDAAAYISLPRLQSTVAFYGESCN